MSEMSAALRKATTRMIKVAEEEGVTIVGFAIPKDLNDDFGWSLFTSCSEPQANELVITIGEILKDTAQNKQYN